MAYPIHRLKKFLSYQQRAQTKYYIHSPFVYQFFLNILDGKAANNLQSINILRNKTFQTYDKILINDMGEGAGIKEKIISDLVSRASVPDKYGKVLFNLVKYFAPHTIIELGTCLGIGTAYMATAGPSARIITIEGSRELADYAGRNFNELKLNNIEQVTGNFDEKLPEVLAGLETIDMAFIDGNHRYGPTMMYFNSLIHKANDNTVLVFDDIYWSREMTDAWTAIKKDPRITLTIDIYRFGIAFMQRDKLAKEDFVLRY
jgi:predicted O-methyltransferase YrrM